MRLLQRPPPLPLVKAEHQPHRENFFKNLIKSTWNQIVFTISWLFWTQTDVRLDPNQLEIRKYNLISGGFNKILKMILCIHGFLLWIPEVVLLDFQNFLSFKF